MATIESSEIKPFEWSISQEDIASLRSRLRGTRFPSQEPVTDWSQGLPSRVAEPLVKYWESEYDMNRLSKYLQSYPQYTTVIDGVNIHFLHIKSQHANATPLLLVHGWPGSVLEFRHVIKPLIDPPAPEGGSQPPAFHLVIPSLPGYGFSSAPRVPGWGMFRTASAYTTLMQRLGYDGGWLAQGGDWGAGVVAALGNQAPKGLRGVHINSAFFNDKQEAAKTEAEGKEVSEGEKRAIALGTKWTTQEDAYFRQHATRPQSLAYGLTDSPAGLLGWIYEKITVWSAHETVKNSDGSEDLVPRLDRDEILDNIGLYWLTNTLSSSIRMYWEAKGDSTGYPIPEHIAVGVSVFPRDLSFGVREWGERYFKNLVQWNETEAGGHFAAWEEPEIFVREVREWATAALK